MRKTLCWSNMSMIFVFGLDGRKRPCYIRLGVTMQKHLEGR